MEASKRQMANRWKPHPPITLLNAGGYFFVVAPEIFVRCAEEGHVNCFQFKIRDGLWTHVDEDDALRILLGCRALGCTTCKDGTVYADVVTLSGKRLTLHRFIMNAASTMDVDHIHHDTLDNRKSGLRVVPRWMNVHNSERTKKNSQPGRCVGVHLKPENNTWTMQVTVLGRVKTISGFRTHEEAARVARAAKKMIFNGDIDGVFKMRRAFEYTCVKCGYRGHSLRSTRKYCPNCDGHYRNMRDCEASNLPV